MVEHMQPAGAGRDKVALVIDDEVFARLFAIQILLDEGFTILEAEDASEGMEVLVRNDDVSLVFTDITMPGEMDGLALARAVRDHRPDVAVIVTSGVSEPNEGELPAGGKFLPKPYTAHSLMSMIRELDRS